MFLFFQGFDADKKALQKTCYMVPKSSKLGTRSNVEEHCSNRSVT